jgi:hypothetical protein
MARAASFNPGRMTAAALLGAAAGLVFGATAHAADAPGSAAVLFREADLAVGEKLIREHKCSECHARKFGNGGAAIYRPQGRVNTPAALRGMVEQCNLELNLAFFPDEVTSISAVLNRDHYRFK